MKLLERRKVALATLEAQLKRGDKPRKNKYNWKDYPPEDLKYDLQGKPYAIKLSDKDITRIQKNIEVLKSRI